MAEAAEEGLFDSSAAGVGPDYSRGWAIYRRRRNLALLLLLGWVPVSAGAFLYSRVELHQPLLVVATTLVWGLLMCWAIWYAGEVRCPRCRRRFGAVGSKHGVTLLFRGLFDPICYNCKLRKFENG